MSILLSAFITGKINVLFVLYNAVWFFNLVLFMYYISILDWCICPGRRSKNNSIYSLVSFSLFFLLLSLCQWAHAFDQNDQSKCFTRVTKSYRLIEKHIWNVLKWCKSKNIGTGQELSCLYFPIFGCDSCQSLLKAFVFGPNAQNVWHNKHDTVCELNVVCGRHWSLASRCKNITINTRYILAMVISLYGNEHHFKSFFTALLVNWWLIYM